MPLSLCLVGMQSLIIFVTVFSDAGKIQEAKLSFGQTIGYATAASMNLLTIVIPVALLLALLMTLTSHARYNELTAMRAAGISLWRICVPYFIVGLIASGAVFALNESVVPRCTDWATRTLTHRSESRDGVSNFAFQNGRANRAWLLKGYYRAGSSKVPVPWVTWVLPDGSQRWLKADWAVRTNGVWMFHNVQELSRADAVSLWTPMFQTNLNELTMPDFDETPDDIAREIRIARYFDITKQNETIPVKDIVGYLHWHPNMSREDRGKLLTDFQERIAMPMTCLVVALIAIPFGAAPGRRNLFVGVAGSIFICFIYFFLQHVGLAFGSSGTWPAWLAAWLPNLFFSIVGLFLMSRIR